MKDKNIFTVNDTVLYKDKEYIISRFETLNSILLVSLVNLNHLVNLKDIEHINSEYKILETKISNNLQQIIWKVKRLSDNEVFTVGDRVYDGILSNVKITKIEIINDRVEFLWEYPENNAKGSKLNFKRLKRIKKPLFTTEDGVDMFKDDKYYCHVNPDFSISESHNITDGSGKLKREKGYYYFSTRKKAEEYILMNKPCLSINDVMNLLEFAYNLNFSSNIRKIKHNLKEFVKSKL